MEIEKSKNIRIKLTWFAFAALVFLTSLCYFLGWAFETKGFIVFLAVIASEFIALWLLCFLLIKFNKSHYKIDAEAIKLCKNNQEVFSIENKNIIKIHYIRFFWTLLLQFGSGYLNITYVCETSDNKKFSTILPTGERIHSISMSLKQSKAVSKILKKELEIK